MMPITQSQGQTLTALLHTIRHDWDLAGIRAALRKAAEIGAFPDIAVAACRCAANPDMRTPALIAEPGPHWQGLAAGLRQVPAMCTDHPTQRARACPTCFELRRPQPATFTVPRPRKRAFTPNPNQEAATTT